VGDTSLSEKRTKIMLFLLNGTGNKLLREYYNHSS